MRDTHSRAHGAEGHQALDVVGVAAAPGVPARVLSPLQDELLPAEAGVLVTDPAAKTERGLPGLPAAARGILLGCWHGGRMWVRGEGWGPASARRLGGEEAVLDVGREPRQCETASGAGEAPTRHPWLQWEMGRSWVPSCTGGSSPGLFCRYLCRPASLQDAPDALLSQRPHFLLVSQL